MKVRSKIIATLVLAVALTQIIALNSYGASKITNCIEEGKGKNIIDTAMDDSKFSTLVTALNAANLTNTLKGEGPFTVFAPTNDAFAKIPQNDLAELLKEENKDKLKGVLTYHVIPGKITAKDVIKLDGKTIKMANGKEAKITVKGKDVFINDSKVIVTDIETKNGVIHVIDTVLMP